MKYFQIMSFILEIIFLILIIALGILFSLNIIEEEKSWLNSKKIYKVILEIIMRALIFCTLIYWAYVSLVPRIIDIPKLITGKLISKTGYPYFFQRGSKDFFQHVDVNGTKVDFFLDSGIKGGDFCKVYYLPNSHRGIMVEKIDSDILTKDKQIGVPWQPILVILYILVAILILNKYAFWFLGVGSLIYYPLNIYLYYSYGKATGAWLPKNNDALVNIIGGLSFLLMILAFYFIEKLLKRRFSDRYVSKFGDLEEAYITKITAHFVVFVYILSTLSYFKLL